MLPPVATTTTTVVYRPRGLQWEKDGGWGERARNQQQPLPLHKEKEAAPGNPRARPQNQESPSSRTCELGRDSARGAGAERPARDSALPGGATASAVMAELAGAPQSEQTEVTAAEAAARGGASFRTAAAGEKPKPRLGESCRPLAVPWCGCYRRQCASSSLSATALQKSRGGHPAPRLVQTL